jgi:hypothetical protein
MKSKTAVEWLANRLIERGLDYSIEDFEQAKEMFELQIIDAHLKGQHYADVFEVPHQIVAEQYYNETFKNNG